MPRLPIRACMLIAAVVWDVRACMRSNEPVHTCNCWDMERRINTERDRLQQGTNEWLADKAMYKKELSACNEKLTNCKNLQFEKDGHLEQALLKLELSNNTLIQREQELQEIRDKLTKCESELPPTVESVRTLHHQVKQHQPIIEKKDAVIAEKDQKIAELTQKVGSLERELAVCQTEQKASKVAIEACDMVKKELEHEQKESRQMEKYNVVGGMTTFFLFICFVVTNTSFQRFFGRIFGVFAGNDDWGLVREEPRLMIQNGRPNDEDDVGDVRRNEDVPQVPEAIAQMDNHVARPFVGEHGGSRAADVQDMDLRARHHHGPKPENGRAGFNTAPAGRSFQLREDMRDINGREVGESYPFDGNADLSGDPSGDMSRPGSGACDGISCGDRNAVGLYRPDQGMMRRRNLTAQVDGVGMDTWQSMASQTVPKSQDYPAKSNASSSRMPPLPPQGIRRASQDRDVNYHDGAPMQSVDRNGPNSYDESSGHGPPAVQGGYPEGNRQYQEPMRRPGQNSLGSGIAGQMNGDDHQMYSSGIRPPRQGSGNAMHIDKDNHSRVSSNDIRQSRQGNSNREFSQVYGTRERQLPEYQDLQHGDGRFYGRYRSYAGPGSDEFENNQPRPRHSRDGARVLGSVRDQNLTHDNAGEVLLQPIPRGGESALPGHQGPGQQGDMGGTRHSTPPMGRGAIPASLIKQDPVSFASASSRDNRSAMILSRSASGDYGNPVNDGAVARDEGNDGSLVASSYSSLVGGGTIAAPSTGEEGKTKKKKRKRKKKGLVQRATSPNEAVEQNVAGTGSLEQESRQLEPARCNEGVQVSSSPVPSLREEERPEHEHEGVQVGTLSYCM